MKNLDLIFPDIHGRKFWREYVEKYLDKVNHIIFLGDYVDPYEQEKYENPENMEEDLIEELKDIIKLKKEYPDKVILLLGNHDCHYIWDNFVDSSRYNKIYSYQYFNIFKQNIFLFNFAWVENNYIFTHSGITNSWGKDVQEYVMNKKEDYNLLEVAKYLAAENNPSSFLIQLLGSCSFYRGGWKDNGSCMWADVREHFNFDGTPIKYPYYQIFGHTQLTEPIITDTWACLDCRKAFLLEDGKLTICK